MEAHLRTERNHAFVLSEPDLKKIWGTLSNKIGGVSAWIQCSDSIERTATSVEEILALENSKRKKIIRIELSARSTSGDKKSRIVFGDNRYRPIEISATGDDGVLTNVGDDIYEIVDGLKPWYSLISKIDFFHIIGFMCWIAFMLLRGMAPDTPSNTELSLSKNILVTSIVLSGFVGIALSIWGLNRIRGIYFPIASFTIGQGIERYRVQENVRWSVIVAFVVSLAASTAFGGFG